MIKADAVFPKLPAEIDVLMIDDGGKIEEADVEILDQASSFENTIERGLSASASCWCSMRTAASFS